MKMKTKLTFCLMMLCALTTRVSHAQKLSPQAAQKAVGARSRLVLRALKNRDMTTLSRYVDAKTGLRFSPYLSVQKSDRVFSVRQLRRLNRDKTRYLWGSYDGSGDPIRLTWSRYYKKFVFSHDFTRAPKTQFNRDIFSGYSDAMRKFYPRAVFVRALFPGFNPKYDGMDWRGLWLVWNRSGKTWKLVGIANDEWTI